jgi:predicted HD superfamily hydrolase involved in NAD metabolism
MLDALKKDFTLTDDLARDVTEFLTKHGCPHTAAHCRDVAAEARRVALKTCMSLQQAEIGGWLHDISTVIPASERIAAAEQLGVEVLPEEASFPMIIHQKLSLVLAREIFGIQDEAILSAIGCHTTLKANASPLDKVVFVADKLAWDQPGTPPYRTEMVAALEHSLDSAALVYLQYLWDRRDQLRVVHPYMVEAYLELSAQNKH